MGEKIRNGNEKTRPHTEITFESLDHLKDWLIFNGIDLSQWGQDEAKTVESLWDEIVNGEVTIHDDPPLRIGQVARVIIRKGDKVLIEAEQEFDDQRTRRRSHPPSEKIKQGESYIEAAARCLREELGLEGQDFEILASTYRQQQTELDSPSYPGLYTRYIFHVVEANVSGLPDTDFWTDESPDNPNDPVRRHRWAWRTQPD